MYHQHTDLIDKWCDLCAERADALHDAKGDPDAYAKAEAMYERLLAPLEAHLDRCNGL